MKKTNHITTKQVQHIAQLAHIPVTPAEETQLATTFEETIDTISQLFEVDTSTVQPTHQVTGLENVLRQDVVTPDTMFTQEQALANAPKTHDGFFVVPRIIEEK